MSVVHETMDHMTGPLTSLDAATAAVFEAWARALPPFGLLPTGDVSEMVGQMHSDGLLALLDSVTALGRRVDGLAAALAGEIARRSPLGSRADSLAHLSGFASPAKLVAASSGGAVARASVLASVGRGTARRRSLTGESLPADHPHLAAALASGAVSVEAAHLIMTMLDRLPSTVEHARRDRAEEMLAEHATRFSLADLNVLVARMSGHLDPDGVEPREEILRQGRSLVMTEDRSGRLTLRGVFDPETGAPIKAALDAYVTTAERAARGHNQPGGDDVADGPADGRGAGGDGAPARPVMREMRSSAQIRADGLADIARHVLACEDRVPGLPVTTVVVRMDVEDLQQRTGGSRFATIDGVAQPISAATARRLACSAGLLPAVFGGASIPLDLGRSARLFSRAQVLALWERDGGCASCGQTTFVEAHHATVDWIQGGRTDLGNGVLLCSRCHHRVHRHHWEISIDREGVVWFIPPPMIDPDRTPRPGVQRQSLRERTRQQQNQYVPQA